MTYQAPATVAVSFDGNGGTASFTSRSYTIGAAYGTLPTATRSGYTFDGWFTASSGGTKVATATAASASITKLYAHWIGIGRTYTVRFHTAYGTDVTKDQAFTVGSSQSLYWKDSQLGWTREGYTFLGWAADGSSGVAKYANGASVKDLGNAGSTVHLYAVWFGGSAYKVVYHRNTTDADSETALQRAWRGTQFKMPWKDSTLGWANPQGYTFLGWAKSKDATSATYANGASAKDLAAAGKTVDLYAVWQKKPYTVKFHRNNGTSETKTRTFAVGAEVQLPWKDSAFGWANPSGKTFLGWGTSAGSVAFYANGAKVKDLAASGATADLHAIWRPASSYIVKFHRNAADGDAVTASQWLATGTASLAWKDSQLKWANPSGWTFLGWAKSKAATTAAYANGEKVTNLAAKGATVDLYAVWQRPTYTVRFHRNNGTSETKTQAIEIGRTMSLSWVNGGLGWANPSGKTLLGWGTSATATIAVYENGGKVKDLAAAGKTVDLYAIWRSTSTYVARYHRNYDGADAEIALQAMSGSTLKLAWKDSQLGWANPSVRTFLGWSLSKTATRADYANGASVMALAKANDIFDFYAVWSGGAAKSAPAPLAAAASAGGDETSLPLWEPGYYRGEFADGSGTFDLVVEEDGAAFFRAETEDGVWSAECEAEVVGETLLLTFENEQFAIRHDRDQYTVETIR